MSQTYCTAGDLESRYSPSIVADLSMGDPARVDQAIADASALISGYIGSRYTLPIEGPQPILVGVACQIVRYSLDLDPDETVRAAHDQAIKTLEKIARGVITLGVPSADSPASHDTAEIVSDPSIWSRSASRGFI